MFITNLTVTNHGVWAGYGCKSKHDFVEGDILGFEDPFVSCPTFLSQRAVPCCSFCFRHGLAFKELVKELIEFYPLHHGSILRMAAFVDGFVFCRWCSLALCQSCRSGKEFVHSIICPGSDASKRGPFLRLRELGSSATESLFLAFLLYAELVARDEGLNLSVFSNFSITRSSPLDPEVLEAWHLVQGYLNTEILFEDFKRVVHTFERTNLHLEIENGTMFKDIEEGFVTCEVGTKLKESHQQVNFPAIVSEDPTDFPIPVSIGSGHYPTVARLNHSCDPNIEWRSVNGSNRIEFVALRDIRAGEELFISYIDQSESRETRQFELENLYGFTCSCSKCCIP